ncbi:sensor histidine kinase [Lentibacillus jeotgali]|uniref:sensor histidine kinase n=1 Tax=Lentibacillus jeotgali TaxID=558169 RepID=UPI00026287B2|nr:HAMP domain-containing sensor histidine kinase [Lentibacillus jeotgali]
MPLHKWIKSVFPKGFLWQLSALNIVIVASAIILSGLAIYNTACFLVDAMGYLNDQQQRQFNSILFNYLLIFAVTTIVSGSLLHFYLTKKLTKPIRNLIESAKQLKKGEYPEPVKNTAQGEVGELTAHFNGLISQLKANDEGRQKLVSDISHELRTPLTNLNGYLQALENGDIKGNTDLYHALHKESKRLTDIIEQIELLKEWGDVSSRPYSDHDEADMANLIEQCIAMFQWKLKQEHLKISVKTDPCTLSLHPEGIQQVITNLIENAIHYYQGEGSISVKGKLGDRFYRVSVSGPSEKIPKEEQHGIFERFYRLDTSRSRETGGSGLGLAIAKEIIEQHNGKIGLNTEANINTFWFELPIP